MNQAKARRGIRVSRLDDMGNLAPSGTIRNVVRPSNMPQMEEEEEMIMREEPNPTPIPIEQKYVYCIDVCNHIASCPMCSKFYNTDKTVYILAIALLSIVCIILMKRMLENK